MIMLTFSTSRSGSFRRSLALSAVLGFVFAVASPASAGQSIDQAADAASLDLEAAKLDMDLTQPEVQKFEETLRDLGYFSGPADGRKGPRLRQAVRDFQSDQGLRSTGSLDPVTVARIGHQARVVGVPNEPPQSALDRAATGGAALPGSGPAAADSAAMDSLPAVTDPGATDSVPDTADPAVTDSLPAAADAPSADPAIADNAPSGAGEPPAAAPPAPAKSRNRVVGVLGKSGEAVVGAGKTAVGGVRTGGKAVVDGTATAGKSTARAGTVAGGAVATAGTKTADGAVYVGKSVVNGTVYVATKTRDLFVGDRGAGREDEQIRRSLLNQYASDERLVGNEIEVRVAKGHVTLAVPEGARSDMQHAARLARITPGVKTVTTVFTSVQEQNGPDPAVSVPPGDPIVDPAMADPLPPEEPSGSGN